MSTLLALTLAVLHGSCAPSLQSLATRWAADHPGLECAAPGDDLALVDRLPPATPGSLQVPVAVGAAAVAYNLLVAGDLKLSPELAAALFQGKIARWNDPRVAAQNPGVTLPDLPVSVVREDPSAQDLLELWLSPQGGAGARATRSKDGGAAALGRTEGAIGAIDAATARRMGLFIASLRNRDGAFVQPAMHSVTRAAVGLKLPPDLRVSIINAAGVDSYPLASFAYAIFPEKPRDPGALADYLRWVIHDGQRALGPLGWAKLPGLVVLLADERLGRLK